MENNLRKLKKKVKGITLVALVVTIIVLLILAGVAISFTLGEDGIFRRAQDASKIYENAQRNEEKELQGVSNNIDDLLKWNINSGDEEEINKNIPNKPILKTGMTAIKFNEPTETSNGTVVEKKQMIVHGIIMMNKNGQMQETKMEVCGYGFQDTHIE